MNFRKNLQHKFPKMRGGVKGRLELFRKFIRFGRGRRPLVPCVLWMICALPRSPFFMQGTCCLFFNTNQVSWEHECLQEQSRRRLQVLMLKTRNIVRVAPASTVGEIFLWNNPADREALGLSREGAEPLNKVAVATSYPISHPIPSHPIPSHPIPCIPFLENPASPQKHRGTESCPHPST